MKLRAARLFEPDRNEEKRTNGCQTFFFYKRTNNIEVKTQSFPQREQTNLRPLK